MKEKLLWYLDTLSFDEVMDSIMFLNKEREYYRKNPKILQKQLKFLAKELTKAV